MGKFFGRKFIITVGTITLIVCNKVFALGVSSEDLHHIVMLAIGYLIGEGGADIAGAYSGGKK